jgi:hypothetical protein
MTDKEFARLYVEHMKQILGNFHREPGFKRSLRAVVARTKTYTPPNR